MSLNIEGQSSGHFDFNAAKGGPEYTAEQFAQYQQMLIGTDASGYYAGYREELKVTPTGEGMSAIINPGGWITQGYYCILDRPATIAFDTEPQGSKRIDTLVMRLDRTQSDDQTASMYIDVKKGASTTGTPVAPELLQGEESSLIYEAPICDVLVTGGATIQITDRRSMIAGGVAPTVDFVRDYSGTNSGLYRGADFVKNAATRYCYVSVLDPENAAAVGLPSAWAKIVHIAHANADGYATQIAIVYASDLPGKNQQVLMRTASANAFGAWVNNAQVFWYTDADTPDFTRLPTGTLVLKVVGD